MKNKTLAWIVVVGFMLAVIVVVIQFKNQKKIGYVTTMKIFEEFQLKKELESDYKKVQMVKQSYLDSLKLCIQEFSLNIKKNDRVLDEKIDAYKKHYLLKEDQFNTENQRLFEQYNEQIWKQLNQYVEDYGKENNYDYLLGASGQGAIMYACEKENITKEVIEYVNNKYRGKKSN